MTDERIRVGFVGCGGISRLYTEIYTDLVDIAQVVAVADPIDALAEKRRHVLTEAYSAEAHRARARVADARGDEERAAQLKRAEAAEAAAGTTIRKYSNHEELLKDDDVQLIAVLTPPPIRAEPIVAGAEAGRHVYSEGPMARSVEEADAIVAAIRKAGVKFHSQVIDRYPRGMVLARRAVESGALGEMGSANVEYNRYHRQEYYRGWHGIWDGEGGGVVFHHGRYIIDPFLWVVNSRVAEVFAYSGPMLRQIEHDSLSQAVVKFDNGATGTIHASLISHTVGKVRGLRGRIKILGSDAALVLYQENHPNGGIESDVTFASVDNPEALKTLEALREEVTDTPADVTQQDQTRLFLESIVNDTEPMVPIEVPHHHVEVVRAIYKSAEEHQPVTLPLDKNDPFYSATGRFTHGITRPS